MQVRNVADMMGVVFKPLVFQRLYCRASTGEYQQYECQREDIEMTGSAIPLSPEAQSLLSAHQQLGTLTRPQYDNLLDTIRASPTLSQQLNEAAGSGHLQGLYFEPVATLGAGGGYSQGDRAISIPSDRLGDPSGADFMPAQLAFVLGHEVQHAVDVPEMDSAKAAFLSDLEGISRNADLAGATVKDYTAPTAELMTAYRWDEARAQIAGWNASVDVVQSQHPDATLADIVQANPGYAQLFVDDASVHPGSYSMKPGISLGPDMAIRPTQANLESVAQSYFDLPATTARIGDNADMNYTQLYGREVLGFIETHEQHYGSALPGQGPIPIQLNMAQLGFDERIMEGNQLNLGAAGDYLPYLDTSRLPPAPRILNDTFIDAAPISPLIEQPVSFGVKDGHSAMTHPAIGLAQGLLDRSPNIPADAFGEDRPRVAAGVAVHAANQQIVPDHIVLNTCQSDLIAVQGCLGDPAARLSTPLRVADAVKTDPAAAQCTLHTLQPVQPQVEPLARSVTMTPDNPTQDAVRHVR